jgi:hypothetical protein
MAANPGSVSPSPNKWNSLLIKSITNFLFWALTLFLVKKTLPAVADWMHGQVPSSVGNITQFFNGGLVVFQVIAGAVLILLFLYIGSLMAAGNLAYFAKLVSKEIFSVLLNTGSLLLAAAAVDPVSNGSGAFLAIISYVVAIMLWKIL